MDRTTSNEPPAVRPARPDRARHGAAADAPLLRAGPPALGAGAASQAAAFAAGVAIWAVFVVELLIRLAIAPRRGPYLRRHWLDALAVLLPVARPLRVLWIARYGSRAYRRPVRSAHVDFLGAYAVGLVLLIATIVTSLERGHDSPVDSFPDALWWSIATVGYGDIVSVTAAGRAFAYVLMLGGIGLVGALTANLALAQRRGAGVA